MPLNGLIRFGWSNFGRLHIKKKMICFLLWFIITTIASNTTLGSMFTHGSYPYQLVMSDWTYPWRPSRPRIRCAVAPQHFSSEVREGFWYRTCRAIGFNRKPKSCIKTLCPSKDQFSFSIPHRRIPRSRICRSSWETWKKILFRLAFEW